VQLKKVDKQQPQVHKGQPIKSALKKKTSKLSPKPGKVRANTVGFKEQKQAQAPPKIKASLEDPQHSPVRQGKAKKGKKAKKVTTQAAEEAKVTDPVNAANNGGKSQAGSTEPFEDAKLSD